MDKIFFAIIALLILLFNSCGKENTPIDDSSLAQKFKGKWILDKINDIPALTDEKFVLTFGSDVFVSTSKRDFDSLNTKWSDYRKYDVQVFSDSLIFSALVKANPEIKMVQIIKNIQFPSNNEILANVIETLYQNGEAIGITTNKRKLLKRISENDYKQSIIGSWLGHKTSKESVYDDDKYHIWQYNTDKSYLYKTDSSGVWITTPTDFAEYFVDGPLLCTRWQNQGENEKREWWEIAINKDTMTWIGLRKTDKGTTYTATFKMIRTQ